MRWRCLAWPRNMIYYFLFVAVAAGAGYVWATKRFGRFIPISSWRNAFNQNWALYRRRLLKRSRSQTPLAVSTTTTTTTIITDSAGDQVPLIISDRVDIPTNHLDLGSVTASTPNVVVSPTPPSISDHQHHQRGSSNLSSVGVRLKELLRSFCLDFSLSSIKFDFERRIIWIDLSDPTLKWFVINSHGLSVSYSIIINIVSSASADWIINNFDDEVVMIREICCVTHLVVVR